MLEDAGERDFLPSYLTALGMVVGLTSLPRAAAILDRALSLARAGGQSSIESWTLQSICSAHLNNGSVDDAQRYADELANIGRQRNDEEAMAQALTLGARISLMRGDLAGARTLFADAVALARVPSAAWPRAFALCGLASVTLATGDDVGARAILEEALLHCGGLGFIRIDSLCGALALLLLAADERERAFRVFGAVAVGAEDDVGFSATLTDPSGALRKATREARALLGRSSRRRSDGGRPRGGVAGRPR